MMISSLEVLVKALADGAEQRGSMAAAEPARKGAPVHPGLAPIDRWPATWRWRRCMPELSRFFGLVILMYYRDHPPPHFHVRYGEQRAIIDIGSLAVLQGRLSPRALGLVTEWAALHRAELAEAWERAQRQEPRGQMAPLE